MFSFYYAIRLSSDGYIVSKIIGMACRVGDYMVLYIVYVFIQNLDRCVIQNTDRSYNNKKRAKAERRMSFEAFAL